MKLVVQRVTSASVRVNQSIVSEIQHGLVVLVGVKTDDTVDDARYLARKVASLRIFEDDNGKMNLDIKHVSGAILSVSQFTLYGDVKDGNRPSFTLAANGETAFPIYEAFNRFLQDDHQLTVKSGVFGAHMAISLENDGPVTLILDSRKS